MTQAELVAKSGVGRSWLSRVVIGHIKKPDDVKLEKLAKGLDMPLDELRRKVYGIPELKDMGGIVEIPRKGYINAGISVETAEQNLGTLKLPEFLVRGKSMDRLFALIVSGDSLSGDNITNGHEVLVEKDADIINGKIYVVKLDNELVARHVYRRDDHLRLVASNGDYDDILATEAAIQGRIILSGNWKEH